MSDTPTPFPEELLSAYLDGECTPDEVAVVERAVAADPALAAILDEVRDTRARLRALPQVQPPPGFVDTIADTPPARPRRTGALILAVAAVFAGVVAALPRSSPSDVTPPVATLAETHAATSSLDADAISTLAPIAVSTRSAP